MDAPTKNSAAPSGRERRQSPRTKIARPVRVRGEGLASETEMHNTRDVSRTGFFFSTNSDNYHIGMRLYVVVGFEPNDPVVREVLAEVVRIEKLPGGLHGIAVRMLPA